MVMSRGLQCYPLEKHQHRLSDGAGNFFIADANAGEMVPEIPHNLDLGSVPALLSISDQGPANTAALNYLSFSKNALMCFSTWDVYHRCWNDLKLSFKRSMCKGWRTILELACVKNLAYGFFGSGSFYFKKKAALEDWLSKHDVSSAGWNSIQHLVARERRVMEPTTWEEKLALFEALYSLQTFRNKGACIKLMRWFSWFEGMQEMKGEFYITKLILSGGQALENNDEAEPAGPLPQAENHQKELQELKKRKGMWALVPTLITDRNLAVKDIILCIGKAAWKRHASRIQDLVMPEQVAEYNISCSRDQAWCDEIIETLQTALEDERHLQHLWPEFLGHQDALLWHMDLLAHLCHTRSMSLSVHHCLPPYLYCHMLSFDARVAFNAAQEALEHWKALRKAEEASLGGVDVKPLHAMHWRLAPLLRTFYMAVEQDFAKGRVNTVNSAACKLLRLFTQHIGDSRVCENVHQHGRDLFRGSKADSMSLTAIMANVLRSGVLEGRRVQTVGFEQSQKAMTSWSSSRKQGVVKNMATRGKTLPKEMQDLMMPKLKAAGLNWPSPSPGALFQTVASTQWLFHYHLAAPNATHVNAAWASFLVQPGQVVAQQTSGLLLLALASAEHAFLAIRLQVECTPDGSNAYRCVLSRDAVQFHYMCDLEDWLHVPTEPFLAGAGGCRGPVMWRKACGQDGAPLPTMSLVGAALVHGGNITYQQMKVLAKRAFDVDIKGNPPLKELQEQLINMSLQGQNAAAAMQKLEQKCPAPQDDMDSELSEVVSQLDHDGNELDLRDLKTKKRHRKLKEAWSRDQEVVQGKPAKAKGKAKGKAAKGKAKAKCKAKATKKRHASFFQLACDRWKRAKVEQGLGDAAAPLGVDNPEEAPQHAEAPLPPVDPQAPQPEVDPQAPQHEEAPQPEEALAPAEVEEEAASGSGSQAPPERASASSCKPIILRRKHHKSPMELLQGLARPGCSLTIGHDDFRFKSIYPFKSKKLEGMGKLKQNHYSLSFAQKRSWIEALEEVHAHVWKRWEVVQSDLPLPAGAFPQTPGHIPSEVLDGLEAHIQKMGRWQGKKKE